MKKTLLSIFAICVALNSFATIHFFYGHSINNSTYHIDLNNDGITDFDFVQAGTTDSVICYSGAEIEVSSGVPAMYNNGGSIGSLPWAGGRYSLADFAGQGQKYVGLRVTVGANKYYGWASISVDAALTQMDMHSWAYSDVANSPIMAGETAIENTVAINPTFSIKPNPVQDVLVVSVTAKENHDAIIQICDMNGRVVKQENTNTKTTEVSVADLNSGIYVVSYIEGAVITRKKFVKN